MLTKFTRALDGWALHPSLLGAFWVLYYYNDLFLYFGLTMLAYCLGAILAVTTALTWALPKLHRARYAVYLTLGLGYLLFGEVVEKAHHAWTSALGLGQVPFRASGLLILAGLLLFGWLARHRPLIKAQRYLNVLLGLYCAWELAGLVRKELEVPARPPAQVNSTACPACPDIYLIVADAYAGPQSLSRFFGFDNTAYQDSLRQRGFYVATAARTNYDLTVRSLGAMLGMEYSAPPKRKRMAMGEWVHYIKYNPTNALLAARGYEFVNASIFDIRHGDALTLGTPNVYAHTSFYFSLFTRTLVGKVYVSLIQKRVLADNRLATYQHFWDQVGRPHQRPRFAYLHLILPHFPMHYNQNGNPAQFQDLRVGYVEQLKFTNRLVLGLVDHIQQHNGRPAIILFTGDHGSRLLANPVDYVADSFTTTTAFYFPDRQYQGLYDSISSVNLFRAVLGNALGQPRPFLPDSTILRPKKRSEVSELEQP
jgi:hypothetical protein